MPLIKSTAEIKQYLSTSAALKFETLQPFIAQAERRYLIPVLGQTQYNTLLTTYVEAGNSTAAIPDENIKALCIIAQEALANLALTLAVPQLAVLLSDAGIRRNDSETTKTAFQYQEQNLQESFAGAGFDALEDMLNLLESNADSYPDWNTSDARAKSKKYFITTGIQLSESYQVYRSSQVYLAVGYIMHRIENFQLLELLGKPLFDDLKANPGTDANKKLINDYICPGIALLTIAKGLIERAVKVDSLGVTVGYIAPDGHKPSKEPAPKGYVESMVQQLMADGSLYLSRMIDFIQSDPETYPLYVDPATSDRFYTINNQQTNSFYGV